MPALPKLQRRPRPLDPHELAVNEVRWAGEIEREHSIEEHLRQREEREWRMVAEERAEEAQRRHEQAARQWALGLFGGSGRPDQ